MTPSEKCSCNITQACPKCSDCVCGSAWCEIHSGPKPQPMTEKCSCDPDVFYICKPCAAKLQHIKLKPTSAPRETSWQCSCNYQTMVVDKAAHEDANAEVERLMRLMKPALDEASFLRGLVKEDEEIESLRLKSEKLLEALKFVETQTEQSESSVAVVIWERASKAIAEWEK